MITEFFIWSKSKVIILFLLIFCGLVSIDKLETDIPEPKQDTIRDIRQFNIDSFKYEMNKTIKDCKFAVKELRKLKERP